jgi:16S rRNA (cytosine1402-N4)-methyltransferase
VPVQARFSELQAVLDELRAGGVDGVLFDLGVSSPQLDDPRRGFSFRFDAPLDMRMDPSQGGSAHDWLERADEAEIREVLSSYGEERFAKQIAKAIVAARRGGTLRRTGELAAVVAAAVRTREPGQDPATRTFQAIRIHVNQELEELSLTLPQALAALRPLGRLVVISFHSLEDRIVKRFMREAARPAVPERLPLRARELPPPKLRIVGRPVRPGAGEIRSNPRARSAVLRVAEKLA